MSFSKIKELAEQVRSLDSNYVVRMERDGLLPGGSVMSEVLRDLARLNMREEDGELLKSNLERSEEVGSSEVKEGASLVVGEEVQPSSSKEE